MTDRVTLPIDGALPEIVNHARFRRSVVVVAPPGAGKTTRVPVALLQAGLVDAAHPTIVLLQPRRVAARAAAARIAEENAWRVGREVGYQIRFERGSARDAASRPDRRDPDAQLLADPFLEGVGAIILDEFHERSLHTDLAIALLREVRESVRDDLVLVVMSATLDAEPIARFLRNAPIVRVQGRTYPVAVTHHPTEAKMPLHERVAVGVQSILDDPDDQLDSGHILVFLPGMEEIRRASQRVEPIAARAGLEVLPLHGSLPAGDQDRAIRPSARRKLILATNVAETSLTIEGVRTVIDTGYARVASSDPERSLDRLELRRISRASAAQRAGRAGRTAPGRCLRLWSTRDERGMPAFDPPEILRVDLSTAILALHAWGQTDPARFGWFEPPPAETIAGAERLLRGLDALGADGRITTLGQRLLDLPLHPRLGRLLIASADMGRLFEGATLAALLSEKDLGARSGPGGPPAPTRLHSRSDLLVRMDQLRDAERHQFRATVRSLGIDPGAARRVAQARDDLIRTARREHGQTTVDLSPGTESTHDPDDELLRSLLLAYPDRVARRREPGGATGVMVGGRGVRLDSESTVRDAELFLVLDARDDRRGRTGEVRVRAASAIEREWLDELFPEFIRVERVVAYDEATGRVVGVSRTLYLDLTIREDRHGAIEPTEAAVALASWLTPRAAEFVRQDERNAAWLDRVACLRDWMPELELPALDDDALADTLETACAGCRSLDDVRQVPLVPLLAARLGPRRARAVDEHAPEHLVVPSGSRFRLSYEPGRPPVLAVRLQELFGWTETPRVAGGRVPVLLHLLAPNFRPVQITDDLRSFWSNTYAQVRKDLRARYPKHAWPEDPWTARAEARGRPRRD